MLSSLFNRFKSPSVLYFHKLNSTYLTTCIYQPCNVFINSRTKVNSTFNQGNRTCIINELDFVHRVIHTYHFVLYSFDFSKFHFWLFSSEHECHKSQRLGYDKELQSAWSATNFYFLIRWNAFPASQSCVCAAYKLFCILSTAPIQLASLPPNRYPPSSWTILRSFKHVERNCRECTQSLHWVFWFIVHLLDTQRPCSRIKTDNSRMCSNDLVKLVRC